MSSSSTGPSASAVAAGSATPSSHSGGLLRSWPILLFMLLSFAGSGAFTPYLQLNFQERGLGSGAIGLLTGIGPALGIVLPLVWGVAADRSGKVRWLLVISSVGAAATFMLMSLPLEFAALMGASALYSAFSLGGGPLSSALMLSEAERTRTDYGNLRLWASVGYGLGILAAGRLVGGRGTGTIFAMYSVMVVVGLIPLLWVREAPFHSRSLDRGKMRAALASRGLQGILLVSFLWRITSAAYYTFFTIYITGMGASPTLVSIAWATALAGEITVLSFAGRIARRIGVRGLLALGVAGSALRWAVYAFVPSPEWAVPFQLLHGCTFAATTTAAVLTVDGIFPPELRSTGQGLLSIAMWGLGGVAGSLAVGALAGPLGYRGLFAASAVGAALTLVLMVVVMRRGSGRPSSGEACVTR